VVADRLGMPYQHPHPASACWAAPQKQGVECSNWWRCRVQQLRTDFANPPIGELGGQRRMLHKAAQVKPLTTAGTTRHQQSGPLYLLYCTSSRQALNLQATRMARSSGRCCRAVSTPKS